MMGRLSQILTLQPVASSLSNNNGDLSTSDSPGTSLCPSEKTSEGELQLLEISEILEPGILQSPQDHDKYLCCSYDSTSSDLRPTTARKSSPSVSAHENNLGDPPLSLDNDYDVPLNFLDEDYGTTIALIQAELDRMSHSAPQIASTSHESSGERPNDDFDGNTSDNIYQFEESFDSLFASSPSSKDLFSAGEISDIPGLVSEDQANFPDWSALGVE